MINVEKTCWVFDLDDTLYFEMDYQSSGYRYLAVHLAQLFHVDLTEVIKQAQQMKQDVLHEICQYLKLPDQAKQSLLWMYRLHKPELNLEPEVSAMLTFLQEKSAGVAIITDGRSISQRNKLQALKLENIDAFISEEWNETKPGIMRFNEVQRRYSQADKFVYVGDNIQKDFITPNNMGWISIGLRGNEKNIHQQDISAVTSDYLPNFWIDTISDLKKFIV